MSTLNVEPAAIAIQVENYVTREIGETEKHDDRSPLDENGIHNLHALAADVYAQGYAEGVRTERERQIARRLRDRERKGADT